ncbi:hypothetical protein RHGRI_004441 [Rhododendron griersonianum]|uniref:ATP-dependent DNA helicase n=1 Tax=Rhododendron griersonianum TaxID=479676 RepID=A0AAV6L9F0_9ERIC|nr:hypothetical protein RHGRI_004441 [Rhododendron griersonianum]
MASRLEKLSESCEMVYAGTRVLLHEVKKLRKEIKRLKEEEEARNLQVEEDNDDNDDEDDDEDDNEEEDDDDDDENDDNEDDEDKDEDEDDGGEDEDNGDEDKGTNDMHYQQDFKIQSLLMDDITNLGQLRRKRNVGIVIHDGPSNAIGVAKEKEKAGGKNKGKAKVTYVGRGKENAIQEGVPNNVISKASLAQRARRERERNERQYSPYQLGQRLRRERERTTERIGSRQSTNPPSLSPTRMGCLEEAMDTTEVIESAQRRQMLQHPGGCSTDMPSTSLPPRIIRHTPILMGCLEEAMETTEHVESAQRRQRLQHLAGCSTSMPSTSLAPQNIRPIATDQHIQEDLCSDGESEDILMNTVVHAESHINPCRHFLGRMDVPCRFCKALHWMDEKLTKSSKKLPLFGKCCLEGKIRLPFLNRPPPLLQALYEGNDDQSRSFRRHTRAYNAANAFTSLGATLDARVLGGTGPTSFTIHGELRHRTGSLLPLPGHDASYAQLYVYDPDSALAIRNRRNPQLRRDVLQTIQGCLSEVNEFIGKYRQAYAILNQLASTGRHLPAHLHYSAAKDRRRFNLPTTDEVAIVIPEDGSESSGMRDIILHLEGNNGLMQINECHPAYLPLHYVLLFPRGELGWEPNLKQWDVNRDQPSSERMTQMQYYSYRLFERLNEYSTILRGRKLFQEFLVDVWASTEQNRLTFHKFNQGKLRAELYQDLRDIGPGDLGPNQIGQRVVLPSSFTGSPRHMFEIFQDSMAITRYNQHPDIFLTMTANPRWPEITAALLPRQTAVDRPDLVARVFELKRRALMREIETNKVFGKKVAHVFTIEFQKRGLPHMHALLFLKGPDKIRTCAQVDKLVCAEFPDPKDDPELFETVKCCMVHGPCGARNPQAPCMENGKCTKRYPRDFVDATSMDEDGYPIYRRRKTDQVYTVRGQPVDNRDVVPYNAYLSRLFNCHINVEVCAGMRCVKYIHKYIYKGYDCATMVLGSINEIQQYLDGRYIGPPEAACRIFGHHLHEEVPTVMRLDLHLPGMHRVNFNPNETLESIRARAAHQKSTLTEFFSWYASNPNACAYTYQEFPQHFVWKKTEKIWMPRITGFAIGRMYFASPNCGEKFYMRLLLTVVKAPKSFECLRTVDNVLHDTYKLACVAKGLLEDDEEWIQCLTEAAIMKTGYQLRRLFSIILTQCSPLQPYALWKQFSLHICDDLAYKIHLLFGISNPTEAQVEDYGLYLLNELLQESGKTLFDFPPMPHPSGNWNAVVGNRLILEHRQLRFEAQQTDAQNQIDSLNNAQRIAFSAIIGSVFRNEGTVFFVSGGAGTGKTFLYNTIALKCRSLGHIVVTVASSGIASLLLLGGRTAHSTFCIPLDVLDDSVCNFSKQSLQGELFRETTLIIWDEVPMQHKHCVEAVDRTLRDIRDSDKPFGGITIVLGGDFRQILPVVTKGVREQIVNASLRRSFLWKHVHVLTLDLNMRLNHVECGNSNFADFLMEIGTNPEEIVKLPSTIHKCQDLNELLSTVYPRLNVASTSTPMFLTERTILSAKNEDVTAINAAALNTFPGDASIYLAADKISEDDEIDRTITNRYPNEYLNSLYPPGLPPFKLELKVGCPVMLLRNIAPKDGLCNGTRVMVVRCASRIIEVQILTGDKFGNSAFIPRISLTPSSSEFPFRMTRRQFPVRLAYALTINKSQGQSVKFVGIDLRTPVFSHGQLYVALSRCTSFRRISVILPTDESDSTTNIVYPEVLL